MDSNSRQKPERGGRPVSRAEVQKAPGANSAPDPVDWINRALFEDWLQRYGSWEAFIKEAGRKKDGAGNDPPTH